jgi:hypothetical protein
MLIVLNPLPEPLSTEELEQRLADATNLPAALNVIDELDRLDRYLMALDGTRFLYPKDQEEFVLACQLERQASATLEQTYAPARVVSDVAPTVREASNRAARLPKPGPPVDIDQAVPAGAGVQDFAVQALALVETLVQGATQRAYVVSQGSLILFTLAVTVWSGLATLYNDKAWGTVPDVIAAIVWGFGATTLIAPILNLVRGFDARPSREAVVAQDSSSKAA